MLQKLGEVDHMVQTLERQLAVLRPRLAAAEMEVQQRMGLITSAKERLVTWGGVASVGRWGGGRAACIER